MNDERKKSVDEILEFWFGTEDAEGRQTQSRWFTVDPEFDRLSARSCSFSAMKTLHPAYLKIGEKSREVVSHCFCSSISFRAICFATRHERLRPMPKRGR